MAGDQQSATCTRWAYRKHHCVRRIPKGIIFSINPYELGFPGLRTKVHELQQASFDDGRERPHDQLYLRLDAWRLADTDGSGAGGWRGAAAHREHLRSALRLGEELVGCADAGGRPGVGAVDEHGVPDGRRHRSFAGVRWCRAADLTTYQYGANGGAEALLVKGVAVASGGTTLRTCFTWNYAHPANPRINRVDY